MKREILDKKFTVSEESTSVLRVFKSPLGVENLSMHILGILCLPILCHVLELSSLSNFLFFKVRVESGSILV